VGEDNAFWFAGGAGGEEDFKGRFLIEAGDGTGFFGGKDREQVLKGDACVDGRQGVNRELAEEDHVADCEFGADIGGDAGSEVGCAGSVEGDGEDATQKAAVEDGDPLGAAFTPDEDAVAGADAALDEEGGEAAGEGGELGVGGDAAAVALIADDGDVAAGAAEVVDQGCQAGAHGASGCFSLLDAGPGGMSSIEPLIWGGIYGIVTVLKVSGWGCGAVAGWFQGISRVISEFPTLEI